MAPALPENVKPRKSLLKSATSNVRSFAEFYFDTFKNPAYVVGAGAAHGGYNLLFQAVMGISVCAAAPWLSPALVPLAIGGCVALTGLALYSIIGGVDDQFRGLSEFYHNRFNKNAPIDPAQKNLIQKFAARPSVQKFFRQPLVRKFLDTRAVKAVLKGPSPKVRKVVLTCMAVETSLFSLVAATSVLVSSTSVIPLVIAGFWAGSSGWGLIQAARNIGLFKRVPGQKRAKNEAVATASAPHAPKVAKATPTLFAKLTAPLRSAFKRSADSKNKWPNASSARLSATPSSKMYAC